jgi:integrase
MGGRFAVEGYVFAGVDGRPIHADRFSKVFRMRVRETEVRHPPSRPRHAHAQHLADAGVHPKAISKRLGHASVAFTIDTYTHPSLRLQREAVEAFSRTMWNPDAIPVSACERLPGRRPPPPRLR